MRISFDTSALQRPLLAHIATGFDAISLVRYNTVLNAAILFHPDGSGLVVQSKTFDVSPNDWIELGYLTFRENFENVEGADRIALPKDLSSVKSACKLVVKEDADGVKGVEAESGLAIESLFGTELIIVSGAMPYSIAVIVDFLQVEDSPEYDLLRYRRELLL